MKKNTFFTTNRWFLLFGLFCAAFLPLLSFQKIVWVEPVISSVDTSNFEVITTNSMINLPLPLPVEENFLISWEMVVGLLYGIGVLVFLTQLLVEFYSLRKIIKSKSKIKVDGFELIEVAEAIAPFSFFKKIVYNRNLFQPEELRNIIEHEKIHAKQLHSLDVLIARIYCIVFWWNPVVWFYKNVMVQNLEFIADHNALAKAKDKKSYLLTLLKITTAEKHVAITNHFYQSLIKKRIVMLHTNQSKKHHVWNYFIVLPALIFFMLTYQVEVVAQEKEMKNDKVEIGPTTVSMKLTANSGEELFKEYASFILKNYGISTEFSNILRDNKGEIISIKIILSDDFGAEKVYDVSGSEAIKPFNINIEIDKDENKTFGFSGAKEVLNPEERFKNQIQKEGDEVKSKLYDGAVTSVMTSVTVIASANEEVFENYQKIFKKLYGVKLEFSKISRNDKGEITTINVFLTDKEGKINTYSTSSSPTEPIKPFIIFANTDIDKNLTFGFAAAVEDQHTKQHFEAVERNKRSYSATQFKFTPNEKEGKNSTKSTPESEVTISELVGDDITKLPKNTLILLNGKVISYKEFETMDPNSIKSVSVVKRATNTIEKYEDLFKKYEERAANGIISIRTEEVKKSVEEENSGWEMDFKTSSAKDNIVLLKENKDVDYKKALITLNGEEITFAEMDKINTKDIENVSVFKGKYNPDFVAMYGEKVKNGIIMIETRGYKAPKLQKKVEKAGTTFKLDPENGSFIIHKRSKRSDIEFYEKYLAEIGIKAEIEGIERNPKGFIMSIKFKLMDEFLKTNMDEWQTFSNPKGIPDIIIGRKNGKILLSAK